MDYGSFYGTQDRSHSRVAGRPCDGLKGGKGSNGPAGHLGGSCFHTRHLRSYSVDPQPMAAAKHKTSTPFVDE